MLIDPGDEGDRIATWVEQSGFKVKYLLHTHAHLDHISGTGILKARWNVPPCLHAADEQIYDNLPMQGEMFILQVILRILLILTQVREYLI